MREDDVAGAGLRGHNTRAGVAETAGMRLRRSAPIRISDALEDSYDATGRWRDEPLRDVDEETPPPDGSEIVCDDVDGPVSDAVAVEPSPRRRRVPRWVVVIALPACSLLAALAVSLAFRALREAPRPSAGTHSTRAAPRPPTSVRLHPPRLRLHTVRHARPPHRRLRRQRPRVRVAAARPAVPAPDVRASGRPGGEFVLGAR